LVLAPTCTNGDYVLADGIGDPRLLDKLRRYMYSLMRQASVTKVTPYEAIRHASWRRGRCARHPECRG
jgi:hypothetical protein